MEDTEGLEERRGFSVIRSNRKRLCALCMKGSSTERELRIPAAERGRAGRVPLLFSTTGVQELEAMAVGVFEVDAPVVSGASVNVAPVLL